MTSQLLATLHPKIKPSKPQICLKMPSWTPQEGPRRAQDSPRWAQDGPETGRRTTGKSRKIIPGALLGPSWGQLRPTWGQLGPSKPILKPTCHPSCFLQALKTTGRPPKGNFASFLKATCLPKSTKIIDFRWVFGIPPSCHKSCPPEPSQAENLPQDALLDPPRRAKEGPR